MAIRLLITFILLPFVLVSSNLEGQQCITRENEPGTCVNFYGCQLALESFRGGRYPTLCSSWDKNIICCPNIGYNNRLSPSSSISQRKCNEYSKIASNVSIFSGLSLGANQVERVESFTCELSLSLIVGGQVTKPGEFPHMAALGWRSGLDGDYAFNCGGSLISDRFVLTAAHCEFWNRQQPTIVRLGDQKLRSKDDNVAEMDVPVEVFIRHEYYNSNTRKNDIGLVKMRYAVKWRKNIRPACLWPSHSIKYAHAIATGFGSTGYGESNSDELLKVQLSIINTAKCGDANIDSTQICAGDLKSGGDTCGGDSGGPLQVTLDNNKCTFYIIGITSYGTPYCGYVPAVYTRVSSYIDWIERKVWA